MDTATLEIAVKVGAAAAGALVGAVVKHALRPSSGAGKIRYVSATASYTPRILSHLSSVELTFQGKRCRCLYETRLAIWNKSRATIDAATIASADPIRWLPTKDHQVLTANVVQESHKGLGARCSVSAGTSEVAIAFDYLEPKTGFVVSIFHEGPPFPPGFGGTAPTLRGSVKGFGPLSMRYPHTELGGRLMDLLRVSPGYWRRLWTLSLVFVIALGIWAPLSEWHDIVATQGVFAFVGIFGFGLMFFPLVLALWSVSTATPLAELYAFNPTWYTLQELVGESTPMRQEHTGNAE